MSVGTTSVPVAGRAPVLPEDELYMQDVALRALRDELRRIKDEEDGKGNRFLPGGAPPRLTYSLDLAHFAPGSIVTRAELARAMGCSIRTTRRMEARGDIPPAASHGGRPLWAVDHVREWILRRMARQVQQAWDAREKAEHRHNPLSLDLITMTEPTNMTYDDLKKLKTDNL